MMSSKFVFRKNDTIGSTDADDDSHYLNTCFVDTGALDILLNLDDPRRIVVGRTGIGKTALLKRITESQEKVLNIPPDTLALSYISNSTILQYLSQLGVKLDTFYKLLWRHVFTVELLSYHFKSSSPNSKESFIQRLVPFLGNKKYQKAVDYLQQWGSSFWQETDYRIKELTNKLESDLKASIKSGLPQLQIELGGQSKLTEEERKEIIYRAQDVVNRVQIKELSDILDLINEVICDPQQKYYILVDRLDEQWVDDQIRYYLIRALIETIRDFKKVTNVKIIISLRIDLLHRVFRLTRDAGFQEEKYSSLYLNILWTREQLGTVLDRRIDHLVKSRYTKACVTHKDLLPGTINGKACLDYVTGLTLMRPRDIIIYFNTCIDLADGRAQITASIANQAEGEYSRIRLRSLADEWYADYPNLIQFASLLKSKTSRFDLVDLTLDQCQNFVLEFLSQRNLKQDTLEELANRLFNQPDAVADFRNGVIAVFYKVGLVGLKTEHFETVNWAYSGNRSISIAEINDNTRVSIHPCFWRALGVKSN